MKNTEQELLAVSVETGETKKTGLSIPADFDWEKLETVKATPNIAPKYIEFNVPGQKIRGFYLGNSKVEKKENDETKVIPVILLATAKGVFMNGGVSLVDTMTKFCRVGEAVEIEFIGLKKVSKGNLKEYAVRPLVL
jgi:hypothetical protein